MWTGGMYKKESHQCTKGRHFHIHKSMIQMAAKVVLEDESALGAGGPRFSPPLYKQRYSAVLEVARKLQPNKAS